MPGWINRENRVPHYQRLYQLNDGKRIWQKSPRSKYILVPYYIALFGVMTTSMYGMVRMLLGHRTWFGKG